MKTLYIDCFSGISGDMTLGALLDMGVAESVLRDGLDKLGLSDGFVLRVERGQKMGIIGTKVSVDLVRLEDAHTHADGTSHNHGDTHEHTHADGTTHSHDHDGDGEHHQDTHEDTHQKHTHTPETRRNLPEISRIIRQSGLSENIKTHALAIFNSLAEAESHVHGVPAEQVHFHEVGGVDALVDIVGSAICMEALGVAQVAAGPVHVGSGMVKTEHGVFPVPAPATLELLRGVPVYAGDTRGELVTPTGAAILSHYAGHFGSMPALVPERVAYGIGQKDFNIPNCVRFVLCDMEDLSTKKA